MQTFSLVMVYSLPIVIFVLIFLSIRSWSRNNEGGEYFPQYELFRSSINTLTKLKDNSMAIQLFDMKKLEEARRNSAVKILEKVRGDILDSTVDLESVTVEEAMVNNVPITTITVKVIDWSDAKV